MILPKNEMSTGGMAIEPDPQMAEEARFSLQEMLRVIRLRRRIILGATAVVVAVVTVVVLQITPRYSATAVVMLDQRKHNLEETNAVLSDLPTDTAAVQNQVQILTSLELANKVVTRLKLDQDPEFNPKGGGLRALIAQFNPLKLLPSDTKTQQEAQGIDPHRSAIVHAILGHLSVSPIGLSTAINVTFESENPEKAAQIANAIANAYVDDQLEAKFEATQKATQWLTQRIGELSQQAQAADTAVQQYKVEHNITTTAEGVSVVDQQIANINQQLVTAKADLAEKEANYERLAALARIGNAANAAPVLSSMVVQNLRTQETVVTNELANMSTKYGPRHPKMLDLQAQKANLDARIADEVQRIVGGAKNDADVARSHVASLEQSLKQAEAQGAGQNQAQVQLSALQSAATSARAMYEAMLGRLNQTQGQQGIQTPDARVISRAERPGGPTFPNKPLAIGLSFPTGIMLGLLLAFLIERLDNGFRTAAEVERYLGVPVLSTIPEVETMAWTKATDLVVDKPMSSFAEAIRGLQLGLSVSNVDKPPQVVVVTSSVPSEGKTTLVISLARMAARSGLTTIIIDADLRRRSVAKMLHQKKLKSGLLEVLTDKVQLDKCLIKDSRSNAWVLPCVQTPASPADVLGSEAMHKLVSNLRQVFDLVLIDSAPLLPVNDTKVVSRLADAVLLVVRWQQTPRDAVANTLRSLLDVRARVAGVALARADYERFRYYSYGYQNYSSYTKYYHD